MISCRSLLYMDFLIKKEIEIAHISKYERFRVQPLVSIKSNIVNVTAD